ncbi:MAG TPA: hypothetical protein VGI23_18965 [Steroidobacteraceae bacterium]|jgi:hypothetical protein
MSKFNMAADDTIGAFVYGTYTLVLDDQGLQRDKCDADDLQAVGAAAVVAHRIAAEGVNIADGFLSRFSVLTGALLTAERGEQGARIVAEWKQARDEYLAVRDDWAS